MSTNPEMLMAKIRALPAERISEVEDFVDFISMREDERSLRGAASRTSEAAFARIWDNPDDDAHDAI